MAAETDNAYILLNPNRLKIPSDHRNLKDRLNAIRWAEQLVDSSNNWRIIETESTGFHDKATIIHLAVMSGSGEELFESLIRPKPRAQVSEEFLDGLNITRKELNNAPTVDDLAPNLKKVLNDQRSISFNAEFRRKMLAQSGIKYFQHMDCLMLKYSAFIGEWMQSKQEYKFQKLPKHGRQWHAMDDCKTTLDLVHFMANYPKPELRPWWKLW